MSSRRARPVVIAHRGASGYLPEHCLPAKALAHGMGADYLEQDIVASRDGVPLVFHDLALEALTDVTDKFPDRARKDGHYYCVDFDWAEIRTLAVHERTDPATGQQRYPDRFPLAAGSFSIHTLEEELRFIRGLNQTTGRAAGIYPEIKEPAWHREQGIDLTDRVLPVLESFGYLETGQAMFLQCFDAVELQAIRRSVGTGVALVQLLGSRVSNVDLPAISGYARAIGPAIGLIHREPSAGQPPPRPDLIREAQGLGLLVHPYTVRADQLPAGMQNLEALLDLLVEKLRVDGLFTDFPDQVVRYLDRHLDGRQSRPQ